MLQESNPEKTLEHLYFEYKSYQKRLHDLDQEIAMLEAVTKNWKDCLREAFLFLKEQAPRTVHEREIQKELKRRLYIEIPIMRDFMDDLRAKDKRINGCGYDRYCYKENL